MELIKHVKPRRTFTRREILAKVAEVAASAASLGYIAYNEHRARQQEQLLAIDVGQRMEGDLFSEMRDFTLLNAVNMTREEMGLNPFVVTPDGELVAER